MGSRSYRHQVWGPEGSPSHPEKRELILPDSGERLLSRSVTTTLGLHSWGRHTERQCSAEKKRTRGRGGGQGVKQRGFTCPRCSLYATQRTQVEWEDLWYHLRRWEGQWWWKIILNLYVIRLLVMQSYVLLRVLSEVINSRWMVLP